MNDKPKTYKMLKTVPGSRDGLKVETFQKNSVHDDLPLELVEQFYEQGVIEKVDGKANPADARETKVSGPSETKVTGPTAYKGQAGEAGIDPKKQRIEELNATARDHYGLDTDTTMDPQAIRDAIDKASDGKEAELPESDADPLTTENATKPAKKPKK